MIEADIIAQLEADVGVGAIADDRIYPEPLPQNPVLPAISYRRISGERDYTLSGPSGLAKVRFQFDCWATLFLTARNLADAVVAALHALPDSDTRITTDLDAFDPEAQVQRVVVDAEILYQV